MMSIFKSLLKNSLCYYAYYYSRIQDDVIYMESRDGNDLADNILSIIEELQKPVYKKYRIYLYIGKTLKGRAESLIGAYGFKNVTVVTSRTRSVMVMESARFIVFDSGLPWQYVKKPGQIVINTWHGTPYKLMGRSVKAERHSLGSIQNRHCISDYLIYPNQYMMDIMVREFMLENICKARCLCAGYPRNSRFFDKERRRHIRESIVAGGRQVIVYMPTYRGSYHNKKNSDQSRRIEEYLQEIDARLRENQILYVKLHPLNDVEVHLSNLKHIRKFPERLSTYDVLLASDILITDYSSVFFDYANLQQKIILFTYDEEEYFEDRGVYFPLGDLPFEKVRTVNELIASINHPEPVDYTAFIKAYKYYDRADTTEKICRHIFNGEHCCNETRVSDNGKENVLIYLGDLSMNELTLSGIELFKTLDDSRNYIACFSYGIPARNRQHIELIPEHINYVVIPFRPLQTLGESRQYRKQMENRGTAEKPGIPAAMEKYFKREWKRMFGSMRLDKIVLWDIHQTFPTLLFSYSEKLLDIYINNDIHKENYINIVKHIFDVSDKVFIPDESLRTYIKNMGKNDDNINFVRNLINEKDIKNRAKKEIEFEKMKWFINSPDIFESEIFKNSIKIITVINFDNNQDYDSLLQVFEKIRNKALNCFLIIAGYYGNCFDSFMYRVLGTKSLNNIMAIKSEMDYTSLIDKCDVYVDISKINKSSYYLKVAKILGLKSYKINDLLNRKVLDI